MRYQNWSSILLGCKATNREDSLAQIKFSGYPVYQELTCWAVATVVGGSYNPSMLINFVGTGSKTESLTREQSKNILQFCRSAGATLFTVNFVFVKGDASEKRMEEFYARLSRFSCGEKDLENSCGDGFARRECWVLDDQSVETILNEANGDLFAYDTPNLPEDWLFYVGDIIVLQIITHEQEATLRISETQYAEFKKLEITHALGCPRWSGLPEEAITTSRPSKPRYWSI